MANLTIKDINSAVMFGSFSNDELISVIDAVKYARSQLGKVVKRQLAVGTPVQFTSSRTGLLMKGKVKKINIKYVIVDTAAGNWRVPANMISAV